MKTYVYIDGFNLYYAIRNTPYKWVNLKILAEHFLPAGHTVERVKYYTAHVSGAADPSQPGRQQAYLRALRTIPEIELFFGNFLAKPAWRPLLNLPIAGRQINPGGATLPAGQYAVVNNGGAANEEMCVGQYGGAHNPTQLRPTANALKVRVHYMEEKGSDVNLAVHLLNDAWKGSFDAAAVISNDTDLVEPIRIVTQELKKPVVLLCPAQKGASPPLSAVSTSVRHLNHTMLKAAQFPDPIALAGGKKITKPTSW